MRAIALFFTLAVVLLGSTGFVPASLSMGTHSREHNGTAHAALVRSVPHLPRTNEQSSSDSFRDRVAFLSRACPRIHPQHVGLGIHYSLQSIIARAAATYDVEESLVYSVIAVESTCNPNAQSAAGASGLMQLMPHTARWLGVKNPHHAEENIMGGTRYLAHLLRRFDGNTAHAIAAYNAGPRNVLRFDGVPPFRETRQYVQRVRQMQERFARLITHHPDAQQSLRAEAPRPRLPNL